MHISLFDLFLAFLGLIFGVPSALPGVFFGSKANSPPMSQAD